MFHKEGHWRGNKDKSNPQTWQWNITRPFSKPLSLHRVHYQWCWQIFWSLCSTSWTLGHSSFKHRGHFPNVAKKTGIPVPTFPLTLPLYPTPNHRRIKWITSHPQLSPHFLFLQSSSSRAFLSLKLCRFLRNSLFYLFIFQFQICCSVSDPRFWEKPGRP